MCARERKIRDRAREEDTVPRSSRESGRGETLVTVEGRKGSCKQLVQRRKLQRIEGDGYTVMEADLPAGCSSTCSLLYLTPLASVSIAAYTDGSTRDPLVSPLSSPRSDRHPPSRIKNHSEPSRNFDLEFESLCRVIRWTSQTNTVNRGRDEE